MKFTYHHSLSPSLKDNQIANPRLQKHRPNKIPTILPLLLISRENRVSKKRFLNPHQLSPIPLQYQQLVGKAYPNTMKLRSLPKIRKLPCKNRLNVLRLSRKQVTLITRNIDLDKIWAFRCSPLIDVQEESKESILSLSPSDTPKPRQRAERIFGETSGMNSSSSAELVGIACTNENLLRKTEEEEDTNDISWCEIHQ